MSLLVVITRNMKSKATCDSIRKASGFCTTVFVWLPGWIFEPSEDFLQFPSSASRKDTMAVALSTTLL